MRLRFLLLWPCLVACICSCGGRPGVQPQQAQAVPGLKEIQKGVGLYRRGCYQSALTHFMRGHELLAAVDHQSGIATSLNNIGNIYRVIGDAPSALLFFDSALAIYTEQMDDAGALQALSNKAAVLIQMQQLDKAADVLDRAEAIAERAGGPSVFLLNNRGVLAMRQGDFVAAESALSQAMAAADFAGSHEKATVFFSMGKLSVARDRHDEALGFFNAALEADRSAGFYQGIAGDLTAIAEIHLQRRQHQRAQDFFERAIKVYALLGQSEKCDALLTRLEALSTKSGRPATVTRHFVKRWLEGDVLAPLCD